MHPVPRRRVLSAALAIATGLTLLPQPASAATTGTLSLPAPTGPYRVGATALDLKDTSRADPWVPTDPARELMVTLWYPTHVAHGTTIPYATAAESEGYLNGKHLGFRPNGYIPALFDLTPHLKAGQNVLAVKVDDKIGRAHV